MLSGELGRFSTTFYLEISTKPSCIRGPYRKSHPRSLPRMGHARRGPCTTFPSLWRGALAYALYRSGEVMPYAVISTCDGSIGREHGDPCIAAASLGVYLVSRRRAAPQTLAPRVYFDNDGVAKWTLPVQADLKRLLKRNFAVTAVEGCPDDTRWHFVNAFPKLFLGLVSQIVD